MKHLNKYLSLALALVLCLSLAACGESNEDYAYTIDDADGDTLTVVEELNDETIRTINNAPKGEELTVTITSEKLYALGLNSRSTPSRSPSRTARAVRPTVASPSNAQTPHRRSPGRTRPSV